MAATAPVRWCWLQLLCVDCRVVLCDCVIGCFLNCWCLPARVLEPLRSGWSGILLPGLSTQLVQPFVHWKKWKRLIHVVHHFQRTLETKTMKFEEQVFRRNLEHKGNKKNAGFSRRRACWIFRRILQNKISDGFLNIREQKKPSDFSRRRACWIFDGSSSPPLIINKSLLLRLLCGRSAE